MARLRARTATLALLSLAGLACGGEVAPGEVRERLADAAPPNLVLFLVDTLRADATSPYGSERDTTPELRAWAERGWLFENARAQSSWTKISMTSLLTSLWPRSHGVREARDGLDDQATTLAEVLREAGYRTWAVQTNGWLHPSFGVQQGFERYRFPHAGGGLVRGRSVWAHADRVYEEAERLLDAHAEAGDSAPFFLYLHFMDVHQYAAPPEYHRYGGDDRGAYLAAVRWVDDVVARVRRKLARNGWLDRSVLVLASDHAEAFGENGVNGHAKNVLTSQVAVPLVIRPPFPVAPLRVRAQVRNLDLAPTLLELAGVPAPRSFEGRSLLPLLLGEEAERDRPSFAALGQPLFAEARVQHTLSDGTWTYVHNRDGKEPREQLFDRRVDPQENVDLATMEPRETARQRRRLEAHRGAASEALRRSGVHIDPGIAERLRALGYLPDGATGDGAP
ncbi:MAG: sulfatase [Myxococcota bacterium]